MLREFLKSPPAEPVEPFDAATVIVVREEPGRPFEVLLMRRNRRQNFMGGAFVFPGGRLDEDDMADDLLPCLDAPPPGVNVLLQEPSLPVAKARGLFVAAVRETFEESGILLANARDGLPLDSANPAALVRRSACRGGLRSRSLSLADIARYEKLHYALDRLLPYSRWITPAVEPRRFDTRFFLARLPAGQTALQDHAEMTECQWLTPAEALSLHGEGMIVLMPPTLRTAEELSAFGTADALFSAASHRRIEPILPEGFVEGEIYGVLLPNDPKYSLSGRQSPSAPGTPSRIVMENGIWKSRPAPGGGRQGL
jgi:8-oxo-dGTP pyrophosphatase MutT (NUDIX family)